jgi:hypothetical protein
MRSTSALGRSGLRQRNVLMQMAYASALGWPLAWLHEGFLLQPSRPWLREGFPPASVRP